MAEKPRAFQRRTGVGEFPRFRGVVKDGRPSAIGFDRLRDAINVRLGGDEISCRGGQSKLSSNTVTGCVFGIHENPGQWQGVKIYTLSGVGDAGLQSYSPEDNPTIQTLHATTGYDHANGGLAAFQDRLHFADVGTLYRIDPIPVNNDQDVSDLAGLNRGVKLFTLAVLIASLKPFRPTLADDERLYVGTVSGGIVYSWDGVSLRADSGNLGAGRQTLATYREDLFVFGSHYAKERDGGSYTNISMPGGTTAFVPFDAAVYKDVLYVIGYDAVAGPVFTPMILSWNGTSLSIARTLPNTGSVGNSSEGGRSLEVFNGYLYYGWVDPTNGPFIGRFDGSSWSDTHKNLGTQSFGLPGSMVAHGGSLFAVVCPSDKVIESPGTNTSGTWVSHGLLGDNSQARGSDIFVF